MHSKTEVIEKSRLGRLLVNRGHISEVQLKEALVGAHAQGLRLGEYLVEQGAISNAVLQQVLKRQKRARKYSAMLALILAPLQPMFAFGATTVKTESVSASQTIEAIQVHQAPESVDVKVGEKAVFSVDASGKRLRYQWLFNGSAIRGETGTTLSLSNVQLSDAGLYQVRITDRFGNKNWTKKAELTVTPAESREISVLEPPQPVSVEEGQPATFSVSAEGADLTYQWRKNGQNIPGATGAVFTIPNAKLADRGDYNVKITNKFGINNWTAKAALDVTQNRNITVLEVPQSKSIEEGQSATFSVSAEGSGIVYQWQKNGQAITGATGTTFTVSNATPADQGEYNVRITNQYGDNNWTVKAALEVAAAPAPEPEVVVPEPEENFDPSVITVLERPAAQTVLQGGSAIFTVVATGTDLTYRWRKDGSVIPGATGSSLVLDNVGEQDIGSYQAIIEDGFGAKKWTGWAELSVIPDSSKEEPDSAADETVVADTISVSFQPVAGEVLAGTSFTLNVSADSESNLTYQWRKNGQDIPDAVMSSLAFDSIEPGDAGTYDVIISDGKQTIVSDPADMTVVVDRTVRLNWVPPSTRSNGERLMPEEIAGYRIYHSTEDGQVEQVYEVPGDAESYELDNLIGGNHYFAVTTIDVNGFESDLSNMANKEVFASR